MQCGPARPSQSTDDGIKALGNGIEQFFEGVQIGANLQGLEDRSREFVLCNPEKMIIFIANIQEGAEEAIPDDKDPSKVLVNSPIVMHSMMGGRD